VTDEEKSLLVKAIEYHESMIPELETISLEDQTKFEEERAYHQNRIEWLKELLNLRNRVTRQEETIHYMLARSQDPHREPLTRLYKRERVLSEKLARAMELLESTQRQSQRLQDENQELRDEKAALADVIADLRMDLKARE